MMHDDSCPYCHGIGFIGYDVPLGDPKFGKIYLCPAIYAVTWDDEMGIYKHEAGRLNWSGFNKTTDQARLLQKTIASLLREGNGMAYIYGPPGLGKTLHAKSACIIARYKYNKVSRYTTQAKIMDWLRTSYDEERGQQVYASRMKDLEDIDFLVVDEVGRQNATDFAKAAWSEIVDRRYSRSDKNTTIWLSNISPEKALDDHQADRIKDVRFSVVHIDGLSYRQVTTKIEEDELWWQKLHEITN